MRHVCGLYRGYTGEVNDSPGPAGISDHRLATVPRKPLSFERCAPFVPFHHEIGAFIIAVIQNGMNLTGFESYEQQIWMGFVILAAVLLDTLKRRKAAVFSALRRLLRFVRQ